jgi:hypothetical protein
MKEYTDFKEAMGKRESSGNYKCKNKFGFLGKYQFGMPRLMDLGLCTRGPKSKKIKWIDGLTESKFLNSPELQDAAFDKHVTLLRHPVVTLYSVYLNQTICGVKITVSGMIACSHLLGLGGLRRFILSGKDGQDGLGTKASSYVGLFSDYDIPDNLPTDLSKVLENIQKAR